jgi:hypothetical protein
MRHQSRRKTQAYRRCAPARLLIAPSGTRKTEQGESPPLQASARVEKRPDPAPALPEISDPCVQTQQARLQSAIVLILGLGLLCALPFVLSIGSVVFLPPVTAMVLTIILAPAADRMVRLGMPNMLASFLALLLMVAVVVVALTLILQPAYVMVDQVPAMVRRVALRLPNCATTWPG